MYEYLEGSLYSKTPAEAVLDVGGVGYRLAIPLPTFERLPAPGGRVRLFAELTVREDSHRLYGFASPHERAFFRALQVVAGVGPALALTIVSSIPLSSFRAAVLTDDAAQLRRIKGVGKRLSERLVIELRDVVRDMGDGDPDDPAEGVMRDARLALEALGFARAQTDKALRRLHEEGTIGTDPGDVVRRALALL